MWLVMVVIYLIVTIALWCCMTCGAIIEKAELEEILVTIPLICILHPIVFALVLWLIINTIIANYQVRKRYNNKKKKKNEN